MYLSWLAHPSPSLPFPPTPRFDVLRVGGWTDGACPAVAQCGDMHADTLDAEDDSEPFPDGERRRRWSWHGSDTGVENPMWQDLSSMRAQLMCAPTHSHPLPDSPWSGEISPKVGVDKRLEKHGVKGGFTTPKRIQGG